jgi:DNA-binding beta-propeller fold protein YncE
MRKVIALLAAVTFSGLFTSTYAAWVYEGQWGSFGPGEGQFDFPEYVAVAPNGNVYVTDNNNARVEYFTPTGSFLGMWGSYGAGDGQFDSPRGIAFASNGNVYVLNLSNVNGRCDFRVPAGASGTITATKKNWVPAQTSFTAE